MNDEDNVSISWSCFRTLWRMNFGDDITDEQLLGSLKKPPKQRTLTRAQLRSLVDFAKVGGPLPIECLNDFARIATKKD